MKKTKRNEIAVRKWMLDEGHTWTSIAKNLDCHYTLVCNTISGLKNNRKVLQFYVDNGCPVKYLNLPADMKEAA